MCYNIIKYYCYSALSSALFFFPIIYIFYQQNGFSPTQIFATEAFFAAWMVLFEVPTGAFADYFGKKLSVVLGSMIWVIACLMFVLWSGFLIYSLANILWALGSALCSWADSALFYSILTKHRKEQDFKKYQGHASLIGFISISLTSIFGGLMPIRTTFICTAIAFAFIAIIVSSINVPHKKLHHESYWWLIWGSILIIRKSQILLWLFVYGSLIMATYKTIQPSTQLYMNQAGIPLMYFWFATAYFFIAAAVWAKLAHRFEKYFHKYSYSILGIIIIVSLILSAIFIAPLSFLIFWLVFLATSIASILIKHAVLAESPTNKQATILSCQSLIERLSLIVILPLWWSGIGIFWIYEMLLIASWILFIGFLWLMIMYWVTFKK